MPAPKFNVVERPNDWAKTMKATEGISSTQTIQFDFWNAFADFAAEYPSIKLSKPHARSYLDVRVSPSNPHPVLQMNLAKNEIYSMIYIHGLDLFEKYQEHRHEIENELGLPLKWHSAQKDARITATYSVDLSDSSNWPAAFKWYCDMIPKLQKIISKYRA